MWRDIAGNRYRITATLLSTCGENDVQAAQESADLKTSPRLARADALGDIAFSPFQGRKTASLAANLRQCVGGVNRYFSRVICDRKDRF
jgi:hypothetical protein